MSINNQGCCYQTQLSMPLVKVSLIYFELKIECYSNSNELVELKTFIAPLSALTII